MAYAFLLFSLERLQTDKEVDLSPLFNCLAIVFLLYLFSGLLRVLKYGRRASRIGIIVTFGVAFLILALLYGSLYVNSLNRERLNVIFIGLAVLVTVAYRLTRANVTYRKKWIAVDVDGVLANQIHNLLPIIERKHGVKLKYEDVTEWDLRLGKLILQPLSERSKVTKGTCR